MLHARPLERTLGIITTPLLVCEDRSFDRAMALSREMRRNRGNQPARVNGLAGAEPKAARIIKKPPTSLGGVLLGRERECLGDEDLSGDVRDRFELSHETEKTLTIRFGQNAESVE